LNDLAVTMREVLVGFFVGSVVGFLLALVISEFRPVRTIVYPYVIGLQSVPKTALAPMFLIWFGFGIESKVALVVSTVFFPVLINTLSGIERTDPDQLDMLRAYCGRRWRIFLRVKLPTALPPLFAGLELAIVLAVIAAVVSEFLAWLSHSHLQHQFGYGRGIRRACGAIRDGVHFARHRPNHGPTYCLLGAASRRCAWRVR
jgi:NitT/TauT family transport system permease protein